MKNNNGTRRILPWSVVGLGIFWAGGAQAQPSALAPSVTLTVPWLLPRDPSATVGFSPGAIAASRLSFQGGVPHQIGGGFANCVSLEQPAGSAGSLFPVRHFTSARVLPALVLQGFLGAVCPARVQNDGWIDLTDELHGGSALHAAGKQWISFGGAEW